MQSQRKRWESCGFHIHHARATNMPRKKKGTYREEAQDRFAGRLQGTNGTSTEACSTRRLSRASSPVRLYSGTGEMGLGRAAQIGALVGGTSSWRPVIRLSGGRAGGAQTQSAITALRGSGGYILSLFVREWSRAVVWARVVLVVGLRSIGLRQRAGRGEGRSSETYTQPP
jgi:hypothetical protein